jgi:hypothetical protein
MRSTRLILFITIILLAFGSVSAQESAPQTPASGAGQSLQWSNRDMTYRGKNYDVLDSTYYPKRRIKQFKQYMNHQNPFPPKPRNMLEAGIGFGLNNLISQIPTLMLWQKGGAGFHMQVRKSWGYIFSTRLQYMYGVAKNLDRQPTESFAGPYTTFGYVPIEYASSGATPTPIYRATRTESSQLNLDMMFNAYNINFHRERNSFAFYGFFGIGGFAYKTRINALDGDYSPYDFSTIVPNTGAKPNTIRKELQSHMDKSYETAADAVGSHTILDHKTLDFAPSFGAGVQYRINKKYNIHLEERYTFLSDNYVEGTQFGPMLGNTVGSYNKNDAMNYFNIGINYNIPYKKHSVEPLYWINPLDHAYNELSYPRHMILPNPVLPDEDGDGITDQFDKCPHTPAGVAVDSHGCPLDTDGDGVPDYKDKQLITPTECQPVDADGVGHCPCPEDCKKDLTEHNSSRKCGGITDNTLLFKDNSNINATMEAQLATLASQMRAYPDCKVVIVGSGSGSKPKEQHSWEHVNAVIEYMSEKHNISRDRFIFQYGHEGDENVVNYRSANMDETGADTVPPPHPEIH